MLSQGCGPGSAQLLTHEAIMQTTFDKEIAQLEGQLQSRLSGRIRDFRLAQRDAGLVLQGLAHSYYAKQLAQQMVMESLDTPILANEIEVR
jgi:hypothetical protein